MEKRRINTVVRPLVRRIGETLDCMKKVRAGEVGSFVIQHTTQALASISEFCHGLCLTHRMFIPLSACLKKFRRSVAEIQAFSR